MPDPDHPDAIASPLSLLLDAASGGSEAEEVLALSFTLDLGFFERTALSISHALGARVTVIGDAGVVTHDPRNTRRAGRSYVSGLASCPRAFHPKLVVIAGIERATVAVGSGNLTLAGWQDNHELWTVLRAGPDGTPDTMRRLATWLRDLPSAVTFGPYAGRALERVAALLEAFEPTETGPTLVTPVWGPVIEQLPMGFAEELNVCCPFHDPKAATLAALIERYDPVRVNVGIQPGLTVCDGPAIAELLYGRDGRVIELSSDRYRHGKLIEVAGGGRRWALTGSPNCSAAALLNSVRHGGNVELGLVSDITDTLMPDGETYTAPQLEAHVYAPRPVPRPAIVVLGAARTDDGVHVQIARPLRTPGHVELSPPKAQPDTWWRIGELAAGASTSITFANPTEGGSRLRVVADSPGGPLLSNIVFVVDPVRATRRLGSTGDVRPTTEPFDLFRSTGLAETFVADLDALRAGHILTPRTAAAGGDGAGPGTPNTGDHVDHGNWEDYLDRCAGRLGHSLLRFALGLPQLSGDPAAWTDLVAAAWDEELPAEDDFGLEGDQAEDAAAGGAAAVVARIPSMADQSQNVRGRYRNWATALADKVPGLGPLARVLALRLIIWTVAAGAWDREDPAWVAVVAKATEGLGCAPPPPAEIEPSTASLAAVAISILRAETPRTMRTPTTLSFERAAKAVAHLLPEVDARYVDVYTQLLDDRFGAAVHPPVVDAVAAEVVQADPFADAVRALDEAGAYGAHRHGRLIHVPGPAANPTLRALEAVGYAEDAAPVGSWAGTNTKWALVVWDPPELLVFTRDKADLWAEYRLTGTYTPRTCASEREIDFRFRVEAPFKGRPLNDAARHAIAAVGLDAPTPPACEG